MKAIKERAKVWALTIIGYVLWKTLIAAFRGRVFGSGVRWH